MLTRFQVLSRKSQHMLTRIDHVDKIPGYVMKGLDPLDPRGFLPCSCVRLGPAATLLTAQYMYASSVLIIHKIYSTLEYELGLLGEGLSPDAC